LRRKKQHEHTLEQTTAQIATLEQQIYSIEAANINRETLAAMERAGEAMQTIHGKLNIDKVDETMYVILLGHMIVEVELLTVCVQGEASRTTCTWRRDCHCYYKRTYRRTYR
jgi:hypothetical protein